LALRDEYECAHDGLAAGVLFNPRPFLPLMMNNLRRRLSIFPLNFKEEERASVTLTYPAQLFLTSFVERAAQLEEEVRLASFKSQKLPPPPEAERAQSTENDTTFAADTTAVSTVTANKSGTSSGRAVKGKTKLSAKEKKERAVSNT
jgi:hypothetical protein